MKKKFFFAAVALVMTAATAVGYKAYDKGNMSEFMYRAEGGDECLA